MNQEQTARLLQGHQNLTFDIGQAPLTGGMPGVGQRIGAHHQQPHQGQGQGGGLRPMAPMQGPGGMQGGPHGQHYGAGGNQYRVRSLFG